MAAKDRAQDQDRAQTKTERNYLKIYKEELSIAWGVKRFHVYLYGRRFTLVTDRKPLTAIFHPKKGFPNMTVARLQRYAFSWPVSTAT